MAVSPKLSIILRTTVPSLICVILVSWAFFFLIIPKIDQILMHQKKEKIKDLTDSVYELVNHYHERYESGELQEPEAKERVLERIRSMRYGPEKEDYFWVNNMQPEMIMHPYTTELEGEDLSDYTDRGGKRLFIEMVELVEEKGSGYIDYMWQWKDREDKIVEKLSYVTGFKPWNWIIGTGIYIEDVKAEIADITGSVTLILTIVIIIIASLSFFIVVNGIKTENIRQRTEDERKALIKDLERKNTEMERFTYTVSHDLRSPLITIKGFSGVLNEDIEKEKYESLLSYSKRIARAADKMKELLDSLLELSRIGRIVNPTERIDLNELINDVLESLSGLIEKKGINITIENRLPEVFADRARMTEVFQNILENAVKFMNGKETPRITIRSYKKGNMIFFEIEDNGRGIDKRYQDRIFGLFEQLDAEAEGNGVGLSLVKRIIDYHGGSVEIQSPGKGLGTTVVFSLPAKKKDDEDESR